MPTLVPPSDDDLVTLFTGALVAESLSEKTIEKYERFLAEFVSWMHGQELTLLDVSYADLQRYLAYLASALRTLTYTDPSGKEQTVRRSLGASSRKGVVGCLRAFYRHCLLAGYIERDPTTGIKTPRVKITPGRVVSMEVIQKFLDAPGRERCRVQAYLFAYTLARVESISQLRWADVDFEQKLVTFDKAKFDRSYTLALHPQLEAALLRWRDAQQRQAKKNSAVAGALANEETAYVLLTRAGRPVARTTLSKQLKWRAARAGILAYEEPRGRFRENTSALSPHMIRRSMATMLRNQGVALDDVADLLNHKDVNTTRNHYARTTTERKRAVIEQITI
jgi:integrase/recombinase XerD